MAEKLIELDSVELAAAVFGSCDENIRLLEKEFSVTAVCRGTQVKLTGEAEGVTGAANAIDAMLTLLENAVNLLRTRHKNGEVYYWILYYSFLSPQKLKNVDEIIEVLRPHIRDISSSTYYRLRKEAVTALSSVLWGFSSQDTLGTLNTFFPYAT